MTSSHYLEYLNIYTPFGNELRDAKGGVEYINATVGQGTLRGYNWPRLRSLSILTVPRISDTFISLASMPKLTSLDFSGRLSPSDVGALCRDRGLAARLQELEIDECESDKDYNEFHGMVEWLLNSTCRLPLLKAVLLPRPGLPGQTGAALLDDFGTSLVY